MLCYKVEVAETEKKDRPLALRVPGSIYDALVEISREHDRPLGYVARELMVRGMNAYRKDGILKDSKTKAIHEK